MLRNARWFTQKVWLVGSKASYLKKEYVGSVCRNTFALRCVLTQPIVRIFVRTQWWVYAMSLDQGLISREWAAVLHWFFHAYLHVEYARSNPPVQGSLVIQRVSLFSLDSNRRISRMIVLVFCGSLTFQFVYWVTCLGNTWIKSQNIWSQSKIYYSLW